jgi:hypothetical protein
LGFGEDRIELERDLLGVAVGADPACAVGVGGA